MTRTMFDCVSWWKISLFLLSSLLLLLLMNPSSTTTTTAFQQQSSSSSSSLSYGCGTRISKSRKVQSSLSSLTTIQGKSYDHNQNIIHRLQLQPKDDKEVEQIEEARLGIWKSRRLTIRSMLKGAESLRNFRIAGGYVPELDPQTGEPIKGTGDNGKFAIGTTAFAVTAGAIILRVGGRAALVNAVGLDFLTDNPDLQGQVSQVLEASESIDPLLKGGLFCLAWTLIKVLCFDAGGIVLALSSGILFGGVLPGTLMSAFGATVGSSVAFGLAKADTPVRKKALELVQDNPSLRGIEKVVAEDGLKAVLTLRLAPILPIPLGMYNYVYGISNVKYLDFAGGIFLGSLKPYLLDSYLGYFGKTLVDGTAAQDGGLQDYILVGVLGLSVLIGVFASQLASETWDAVLEEQKEESKSKGEYDEDNDEVTTELFGWELPQWLVGFQYALNDAEARIDELVLQEYNAKVWNYTEPKTNLMGKKEISNTDLPDTMNPAKNDPKSPEITDRYKGIDFGASTCDGLVLSPILFGYFLKFADPLFDENQFWKERQEKQLRKATRANGGVPNKELSMASSSSSSSGTTTTTTPVLSSSTTSSPSRDKSTSNENDNSGNDNTIPPTVKFQLNQLQQLRKETRERLEKANKDLEGLSTASASSLSSGTTTTTTTTPLASSSTMSSPSRDKSISNGTDISTIINTILPMVETQSNQLRQQRKGTDELLEKTQEQSEKTMLDRLQQLREETQVRLEKANKELDKLDRKK